MSIVRHSAFLLGAMLCCVASPAMAQTNVMVLDTFIETHRIENQSASWQTITLANSYTAPVVVCSYVLPSASDNEGHTRVRNVGPTSFELRIQRFENSSALTSSDVHCLIVETGAHTLADGRNIEARTVLSDGTNGSALGWGSALAENVASSLTSSFSAISVFGQVMTYNDPQATVFWTNNCNNRGTPPTPNNFCVGKHIGQINDTRLNETLGYIVVERGSGSANGVDYIFQLGGNSIEGVGNNPPYSYSLSGDFETAIVTQAAENGGNGGWAVLYGNDPLPPNSIQLAIDEETIAGDTTRFHIDEQVFYSAFASNQMAQFSADKTVEMASDNASIYAIPGSDVIYTLSLENTGNGPADLNSIFLVDALPEEMEFFNGDFDGAGPGTGPVFFEAGNSGLTLGSADIGFSFSTTRPTSMAQCGDSPASGYVDTVKHICFAPKGYARAVNLYPGNEANISFRMRIP